MLKIGVCIEMVLTGLPYEERIKKIAQAGFGAIEFWFHDATFDGNGCSSELPKEASALRQVCRENGLEITNMVVNSPDGSIGGSPVDARDLNKYLDRLHEVIIFSQMMGCGKAITCSGNMPPGVSRMKMRESLDRAYGEAADIASTNNFTLLLEPLNTYVDHKGYYLDSSFEAAEIVKDINHPSFRLLYDIYHMQIMEGNVISTIKKNFDIIGHFHSAGVPGRHELMDCELNYREILSSIDSLGYAGAFGLEYSPSMTGDASLKAMRAYLSDFMGDERIGHL